MTDPTLSYQIARYQRSDRAEVFAFLRAAHPDGHGERLVRQWSWKYDANPFNREADPYVLLMRHDGTVVAMLGSLPLRVAIHGQEHWASHSCDWTVHPEYRDRRLARRLVERHRADRPLRFSWQNELSHRRSQQRADTGTLRIVPLVKVLDFGAALARLTGSHALGRYGSVLANAARRLPRGPAAVAGVTVAPVSDFGERFDGLWQRAGATAPVMVVRDQRYLQWRFTARPDARYTVLAATRAADVLGYVVTRTVEAAGARWGYLVDFLVDDTAAACFSLLLGAVVDLLRRDGAVAVSTRVTAPALRRRLYRRGFWPFVWGRPSYLRSNVNTPDPAVQVFRDPRHWHLTMGDGDLEMAF